MAMPPISQSTKNLLGIENAKYPGYESDPNVGKVCYMAAGVYKGIYGILYSKASGIKYVGSFQDSFVAKELEESAKKYVFTMFFKTGEFFCAVAVDVDDVVGDLVGSTPGDGSNGAPFSCGSFMSKPILKGKYVDMVHQLSPLPMYHQVSFYTGRAVNTGFPSNDKKFSDFTKITVFFDGDLSNPIAQSGSIEGSVRDTWASIKFYCDPQYNPSRVIFRFEWTRGIASSSDSWAVPYKLVCPQQS